MRNNLFFGYLPLACKGRRFEKTLLFVKKLVLLDAICLQVMISSHQRANLLFEIYLLGDLADPSRSIKSLQALVNSSQWLSKLVLVDFSVVYVSQAKFRHNIQARIMRRNSPQRNPQHMRTMGLGSASQIACGIVYSVTSASVMDVRILAYFLGDE